jgi:integrase
MNTWKTIKENLRRNVDSGIYYAVVKIKGKTIWRTLETDLRTLADFRLPGALAKIQASKGAANSPNVTLGQCAEVYLLRKKERGYRRRNRQGIEQAKSKPLKERSMDYRNETVEALKRCWKGFDAQPAALVTEVMCHTIADVIRKEEYSASRFNGMIQSLRGIMDIAVENGAVRSNPAMSVSFVEIKPADKPIPTREQVTEILRLLDSHPRRTHARLSVRVAMFTGLRPNEARHLQKQDIDLVAGTLTARETKNGKPRTIQLIGQAIELFQAEGVDEVIAALKKDPRRTIRTIGDLIGVKMSPYTMRYLHATALVEAGVDLPTAARILGHQDHGATLARHYFQSRSEHLKAQLKKVII